MISIWPLKFREATDGDILLADDAGGFFRSNEAFLTRYASGALTADDHTFLLSNGHAFRNELDPAYLSFAYRWARRQSVRHELSYVILVPTLRCNLTCDYCQVSRAPATARGFDWTEETLAATIAFLDRIDSSALKIEFQGGEPLLRLDLLDAVRRFCRSRFSQSQFVVCTNLQNVTEEAWFFLASEDTFISTSLDGDRGTHQRQRTRSDQSTAEFFANLDHAIERFGPSKISALPTIDVDRPPSSDTLISAFANLGLTSIYLRPINYQGFARRRGQADSGSLHRWSEYHSSFVEALIAYNFNNNAQLEEYYFSQCLRRVLRLDADNHVDLRNPSFLATDYIVVDYDGRFYPSDEARMLSRIGQVDLSVGNVKDGIDEVKVGQLNMASMNNFDPDCIHCVYQPFCGTDIVDDLSRYGRIDLRRAETWFCQRHLAVFDKVFELLYRQDAATRHSLAHWAGIQDWPEGIVSRHI
ncbi:MAG: His-Xaa-Ser system radical SAM maturase HxsB [Rhizobiaceae bacterium]